MMNYTFNFYLHVYFVVELRTFAVVANYLIPVAKLFVTNPSVVAQLVTNPSVVAQPVAPRIKKLLFFHAVIGLWRERRE
jgi:hypothetical protein